MRLLAATLLIASAVHAQDAPDLPVEKTKKNIRVLTGMPSSQVIPVMTVMANSPASPATTVMKTRRESDAKPAKEATRRMIRLVRSINDRDYEGRTVVTCNTCHRGSTGTVPVPSLADAAYRHTESAI